MEDLLQKQYMKLRKQRRVAAKVYFAEQFTSQDIPTSKVVDQIADFIININQPMKAINNHFIDAYSAQKHGDQSPNYYAIVFKDLNIPIRIAEIFLLKQHKIPNLLLPEAIGLTEISTDKARKLVVIFRVPSGTPLSKLLKTGTIFSDNFIINKIAKETSVTLSELHKLGIMHGNININNILVDENQNITISECISSICGFYQEAFYETPSRAICNQSAKSLDDFQADYYALGMTIFATYAKEINSSYESSYIIQSKLHGGTYNFLNQLCIITGKLSYLIQGLVHDEPMLRWQYAQLKEAIDSKHYDIERLNDGLLFQKPIKFNEEEYYSRASLAFAMYQNWNAALNFIKSGQINEWLLSNGVDISNLFAVIDNARIQHSTLNEDCCFPYNLKLTLMLCILDPTGPIRLKELAFYLREMPNLIAISYNSDQRYMKILYCIMLTDFFKVLDVIYSVPGSIYTSTDFDSISNWTQYLLMDTIGFGHTRCLYEMSPYMPCKFFLDRGDVIWNVASLMNKFENSNISISKASVNEDVIAFMSTKLGIKKKISFEEFSDFPILSASSEVMFLALCAKAQKKHDIKKLPMLCQQFAMYIQDITPNLLKGSTAQYKLSNAVKNSSKYGICEYLLRIITRTQYFKKDAREYRNALSNYEQLKSKYEAYKAQHQNNSGTYLYGIDIVMRIGYIAFIISLLMVILEAMKL